MDRKRHRCLRCGLIGHYLPRCQNPGVEESRVDRDRRLRTAKKTINRCVSVSAELYDRILDEAWRRKVTLRAIVEEAMK